MRNNLYSVISLTFGVLILLNPVPWIENSYTESFDNFVLELTNYRWMWASIDITYVISQLVPFMLLSLSIFFAVKGMRTKVVQSKMQRMISVILSTLSVGILISIIGTSIYLWLVI